MLQCQYWRRRWIIQETSVSCNHMLLCGDEAIALDDFQRSAALCLKSPYWNTDLGQACSWFHDILSFRSSYKAGSQNLIDAIDRSRSFQSEDPRDAIFSLLGICQDGLELMPTPNYSESIELVLIDLTRALVQKYKNLNIIFSGQVVRSETLPSWVPNWLSDKMPSEAYDFRPSDPNSSPWAFSYERYRNLGIPVGLRGALRVQGGCNWPNHKRYLEHQSRQLSPGTISTNFAPGLCEYSQSKGQYCGLLQWARYRHGSHELLHSFVSRGSQVCHGGSCQSALHTHTHCVRRVWDMFCHQIPSRYQDQSSTGDAIDRNDSVENARSNLAKWLEANSQFLVQGKTLEDWRSERVFYVRALLPFLHSKSYFVLQFCFFCIVCAALPGVLLAGIFHVYIIIVPCLLGFLAVIAM